MEGADGASTTQLEHQTMQRKLSNVHEIMSIALGVSTASVERSVPRASHQVLTAITGPPSNDATLCACTGMTLCGSGWLGTSLLLCLGYLAECREARGRAAPFVLCD